MKIGKLPQKDKQQQTRTNKNGHFSFKGRFAQAKRQAVKGLTFDKTFDTALIPALTTASKKGKIYIFLGRFFSKFSWMFLNPNNFIIVLIY